MVTIKNIRKIFREILQENETKQKGMLAKDEQYVLDLISGHQALLNHRFDNVTVLL